jgi:hypothetical protein
MSGLRSSRLRASTVPRTSPFIVSRASQAGKQRVDFVLGLELNHPAG